MRFLVVHAQEPQVAGTGAGARTAFDTQQLPEQSWIPASLWSPNDVRPQIGALANPHLQWNAMKDIRQTSSLLEPTKEANPPFATQQLSQPCQLSQPFQPVIGAFVFGAPNKSNAAAVLPMPQSSGNSRSGHPHSSEVCMRLCRKRGEPCLACCHTSEQILMKVQVPHVLHKSL